MAHQGNLVKFPFKYLVIWGCGWPTVGISSCLLISVLYHFDKVTNTHCRVPNILPSISAAVGDVSPQKHIFRASIGLHCPVVYLLAFCYYQYFNSMPLSTAYRRLNLIILATRWVEITALLLLAVVSSTENHSAHEKFFITFVVASYLDMVMLMVMLRWSRKRPLTHEERRSLNAKFIMFVTSLVAMLASGYFFYRHNAYCEPYIYSFYGGLEYAVVALNIAFHGSVHMDLGKSRCLTVGYDSATV